MSIEKMGELLPEATGLQSLSIRLFTATVEVSRERFRRYQANNSHGIGFDPPPGDMYPEILEKMGKSMGDYCQHANEAMSMVSWRMVNAFDYALKMFLKDETHSERISVADLYEQVQDRVAEDYYEAIRSNPNGVFPPRG